MRAVLEDDGRVVETYSSCEAFLEAFDPGKSACLLIDAYLPGMSGLELLERLHNDGHSLPAIMITGNADVPMAVQAMKAGALDFIEKPIGREEVIASIERALELSRELWKVAGIARVSVSSPRGSHDPTTRSDGKGACGPAEQEHCRRSRHQPAHRREPSRRHHEENRIEVAARAGEVGALGGGLSKNSRHRVLRSRDPLAVSPREYAPEPLADECDHRRFWLWPESAPKGSPPGRNAGNALRQFGYPRFGGPGHGGASRSIVSDPFTYEQDGLSAPGPRNREGAQGRCISRF